MLNRKSADDQNRKPINKHFISSDNEGIIVSVNISFYNPTTDSFLLCKEMRKPTPQSNHKEEQMHIFGGKVEPTDISPFYTGVREFVEELNYQHEDMNRDQVIKYIYNQTMTREIDTIIKYKDVCVSPRNRLFNRFYIINLNTLRMEFRKELSNKINSFTPGNDTITSLFFHERELALENPSSLLASIFKTFPSRQRLENH